jgi:N-acetylglutamate synthase-like GNAT family acetyltransferase
MHRNAELRIRPLAAGEADVCEQIIRSLPDWFGIEEAIVQYRRDLDRMETLVAEMDGRIVGFVAIHEHNPHSAEIHVVAIQKEFHGRGIGRGLFTRVEELLRRRSIEFLQVKTLGPSRPDANYDRTRSFYLAMGFRPLEENKLWGERNPCLIMVKHLACRA